MKAIMISGRTLGQGASCEAKMSTDFFKAVSICSISKEDFGTLGIEKDGQVLIKSDFGQVVLSARAEIGLSPGIVFIPMGPWANALVGADTGGCGTPQFKGVEVEIEPTDQPVPNIQELFGDLGRVQS